MFKQLLTIAAAACIFVGASAATLWESEDAKGFLVDWGKPCVALTAAEVAEAIVPGDYIQVTTVGVDPENGWPQVALFGQYGGWPPLANEGVGGKGDNYPYVSSFPVTNELYASISAEGLSVSGNGAYVGKVEVVSSGVEVGPNTVWFGNKECGWGNGVSLPASLFADVRVGDKLVFYTNDQSFQVLLGGWSGLNLPAYDGSIANKTYVDGVTTITMIPEYTESNVYEEGKDAINVFELIKANGVIMHGTTTITRIDYIPTDILEETVGHVTTIPSWEDVPNIAPAADLQIQVLKGDKVRINAWAGYEGYDIIVAYDEDWNITALTPVVNGKEDQTYTEGWAYLYTGNEDEYFAAYLSEGYDMAGAEDGEGLVWLQGYLNGTDLMYYYVEWPLTAEELEYAIMEANDEDVAQIQEWYECYMGLQDEYAGFAATEAGADALSAIANAIMTYNEEVQAALEAAVVSWGYTSPLTGAIITEVNELIIGTVAAKEEFFQSIDALAQADAEILVAYANQVEAMGGSEDIANNIVVKLVELFDEIEAAGNKALDETGVYVSPITDEVIAELNKLMDDLKTSSINSIDADACSATYFNINGQQVKNPAPGQFVIKVKNGKAVKVLVK